VTALTATALLNQARATRDFREGTNNANPFWTWPPRHAWLANAKYCASWISWCAWKASGDQGLRAIGGGHYNCAQWAADARRAGMFVPWNGMPRRGDLVLFDWSGRHRNSMHIGILERVDRGVLVTWEANTTGPYSQGDQSDGGGVYQRRRSTLYVVGFVRPRYASERAVQAVTRSTRLTLAPLAVTGVMDPPTVRRLQTYLRVGVDGAMGPRTVAALQRFVGVKADGNVGPVTVRALQAKVGVQRDGVWGRGTTRGLQRYLNRHLG